ncbi:hypothetical protein GCM10022236_00220 [Microlunatus ginsengisoli]|uniref:Uncharacterized protein n=1 Tax=Microlunatus ginsengisoli TaxID=363863 RepID=A0ABP6ZAF6_9ACTN
MNGAVWNSILMFGYFWVTMSATWSQAFFSTSEPDHMNQVSVTGPPLPEPELPGLLPLVLLHAANTIVAAAAANTLVRREIRISTPRAGRRCLGLAPGLRTALSVKTSYV